MAIRSRAKVTFKTGRLVKRTLKARQAGLEEVAREITRDLKKAIGRPGPPPSKPGRFPKKDTGRMHRETKAVRVGRKIVVQTTGYGPLLDTGTRNMAARPWLSKKVFSADAGRKWRRRINTAIRKHAKK